MFYLFIIQMHHLPYEIINHILYFVPDKIYASRTCKLFLKMLHEMYESKKITNNNDPYVLSKYCNSMHCQFHGITVNDMAKIVNHKSLDYFMYRYNKNNIFFSGNRIMHLLIQHCISGHISNQNNILKLVDNLDIFDCPVLLCFIFLYKTYDALPIIMSNSKMKKAWFDCARVIYGVETNIDSIVVEINMMVEMGIMDYEYIYDYIQKWCRYGWLEIRVELIEYLEKKMKS